MANGQLNGSAFTPVSSGGGGPNGGPDGGGHNGGRHFGGRGPQGQGGEPVFNMPAPVMVFAGLLLLVHLVRLYILSTDQDVWTLMALSFIPLRYGELASRLPLPEAAYWSPITYSFLHASWMHLVVNTLWLLAFATPVVRRLGLVKSLVILLLSSLGGAAAYYLAHAGEMAPMIGASGVVSGFMGAAARFAFTGRLGTAFNVHGPAQSLVAAFSNPTFLTFLLVWLLINLFTGLGSFALAGEGVSIAWQAHLGGFAAGMLSFSLLDRNR